MNKPRVLSLPSVEFSNRPESVCIRIVVDADNYDYLRLTLTPDEAIRFGNDIISDGLRAMHFKERREWMERSQNEAG